jgi:hypothetical protein
MPPAPRKNISLSAHFSTISPIAAAPRCVFGVDNQIQLLFTKILIIIIFETIIKKFSRKKLLIFPNSSQKNPNSLE